MALHTSSGSKMEGGIMEWNGTARGGLKESCCSSVAFCIDIEFLHLQNLQPLCVRSHTLWLYAPASCGCVVDARRMTWSGSSAKFMLVKIFVRAQQKALLEEHDGQNLYTKEDIQTCWPVSLDRGRGMHTLSQHKQDKSKITIILFRPHSSCRVR